MSQCGTSIAATTRNAVIHAVLFVASGGLPQRVIGSGNGDSAKMAKFAADVDRSRGFEQKSQPYHLDPGVHRGTAQASQRKYHFRFFVGSDFSGLD
jgi:hypothetical protein